MCYNAHIVHPRRDASKPTRNGFVHLMIPILIATSLSCSDAYALIEAMESYDIKEETRTEMIQVVKEEVDWCDYETQKPTEGTG